jgi:hypothetical protein
MTRLPDDLPCSADDLVRFLKIVKELGNEVSNGHLMAVGGQRVFLQIIEPLEKAPPLASIVGGNQLPFEWQVRFFLPKGYPHEPKLLGFNSAKTHIHTIGFTGDRDIFLRDLTFAKMMA